MHPRSTMLLALMGLIAAGSTGPAPTAQAQSVIEHLIPQSLQVEQTQTTEQLSQLAQRQGPVGEAAANALELYKKHAARERGFILPPLTLLPYLADGGVTPDMAWALPMIDRVRAEREKIFDEHTQLTEVLNALAVVAAQTHDNEAKEFAESAAMDSLNDLEILEPTLLLIGDILRTKLPAAH
jgi:hypothetical protein